MTDYSELIKQLREYANEYEHGTPTGDTFDDAAAAIEDMAKHITEMHERVTVLQIARGELEAEVKRLKESNEELQQIADHYEQTAKDYWKEACEYKAQLPKRGQYVHGRELSREYNGDCLVSIDYEDWRCSVCGIVFEQWSIPKYNYCPNCGAKMEVQDGTNREF